MQVADLNPCPNRELAGSGTIRGPLRSVGRH